MHLKHRGTHEEWQLIAEVTFHDLRHDFAHRARAAGWSLEEIAVYAGHQTKDGAPAITTTVCYTLPSRQQLIERIQGFQADKPRQDREGEQAVAKEEASRAIYQFHILLLKISPAIWRRMLVPSDQSLADFHDTLQIVIRVSGQGCGCISRVGQTNVLQGVKLFGQMAQLD